MARLKLKSRPVTESDVKRDVLRLLSVHTMVAFAKRSNTGAHKITDANGKQRFIRYGEKGDADITGMLKDGTRFEVELKRPEWKPRNDKDKDRFISQLEYLCKVNKYGGLGILADSWEVVQKCIEDSHAAFNMALSIKGKLEDIKNG